jgi:hypothetical protein
MPWQRPRFRRLAVAVIATGAVLIAFAAHHRWISRTIASRLAESTAVDPSMTVDDLELPGRQLASMRIDAAWTGHALLIGSLVFLAFWGILTLGVRRLFRWRLVTAMIGVALIGIGFGAWNLWVRSLVYERAADRHTSLANWNKSVATSARTQIAEIESIEESRRKAILEIQGILDQTLREGRQGGTIRTQLDQIKKRMTDWTPIKKSIQDSAADADRWLEYHSEMERIYRRSASRPWVLLTPIPEPARFSSESVE